MLLFAAFFLSGSVALIYQVLWTRQLGLVFGVTIQAASTVLACFMGGLALGSYFAGRWSDRLARPLLAFALVEVGIALSALLTPAALELTDRLIVTLTASLSGWLLTVARVCLTAFVLLIPATLMGMTYPLVLRAMSRSADGIRRMASLLYAVNTTGAIAGVVAGSLWLVPGLGLRRTFLVAAGLNALVAVIAFAVSRRSGDIGAPVSMPDSGEQPAVADQPLSRTALATVLVVIALSGAVSLALEIVWFRILVFFLRPTTYAFACMLAAVLAGLAAGSYLVTPWLRRRTNWLALFGLMEVAVGLTGLLSAFLMVRAHDVMVWLFEALDAFNPPWDFVLPLFFAAAFAILPTSLLLGAAFPVGLVLWSTGPADDQTRLGRRVGTLYALNVGGAIVGSLAAGFLLVPALGAQGTLILVTSLPLAGGLLLIWMAGARWRAVAVPVFAAAFAVTAFVLPDLFQSVIRSRYPEFKVVWHAEDAQATVSVIQEGEHRMLLIDGAHHSSDGTNQVNFHRAIGSLAVAVHPNPRRVLVIGMGGGTTSGGAAILPNTQTTVVELSSSVIKAGTWFERTNRRVLDNPNVTFKVADGRHFLKTTTEKFDAITADLMLPQWAGAANLYSVDYYKLARRALAPGGIMVQWIPIDTEFQHKLMLRSFLAAFPNVTLWMGGGIAIGSDHRLSLRETDFALKLAYPQAEQALKEAGMGSFADLKRQYFTDRARVEAYLGDGPMLQDDKPVIEYFLSLPANSPPANLRPFWDANSLIIDR